MDKRQDIEPQQARHAATPTQGPGVFARGLSGHGGTRRWLAGSALLTALLVPLLRAQSVQFLQQGFEAREPVWIRGASDATPKETAHRLTDETAHGGYRSEYIELQAQRGTFIHYTFPVGRGPINEELIAALWVKANRPGTQLLARVVLPHERDPKNLAQPLTTLLRGDGYQTAGRWQRVELRQPVRLLQQQQQLLRAELRRDVSIADAYIDQLVLNVYGGPGLTRVWTDDLEIGPVLDLKKNEPPSRPDRPTTGSPREAPRRRAAVVKLEQEQLIVGGRKFFLRGIRYSGTPLKTLRHAGFNTVWFDEAAEPELVAQAADLGFWLVPMLAPENRPQPVPVKGTVQGQLTSTQLVARRLAPFLRQESVLCWDLGGGLAEEQYTSIMKTYHAVRAVDPSRPFAADVWDGFKPYSRGIDQVMLGIHRWPLMTGLELNQYREWLAQRRNLAHYGTFCWTWVQTHLPQWFTTVAYEKTPAAAFNEPIGPQPEQIRLLTYLAIAAGYRGLGFWSDRFLADSHAGRDRLLQLALLNLEMQLLEPLLVSAKTPLWIDTSVPEIKAAVMRTDYGVLCLPIWVGAGSQFVPGQAAVANLTLVVPQIPTGTQPWLVSAAEARTLRSERVVGGTKITIPEFGLTAAVVFTGDLSPTGLVVHFQNETRKVSRDAAQWACDLAEEEFAKVSKVEIELESLGRTLPDSGTLMEDARRRVRLAANHRRNGNSREAYAEAERALRPLRILMRAQWEKAARELDTPTASPYAVSFYTLPRHWRFRDQLARMQAAANVLPGGDFEQAPGEHSEITRTGWTGAQQALWQIDDDKSNLDDVVKSTRWVDAKTAEPKPVPGQTRQGLPEPDRGRVLLLEIKPKDPKAAPVALERTFLAVHSPAVRLPVGTLVQISGWVRIPEAITASADGALFYDSAGGEPLAVRLTGAVPKWKPFRLYRRVPASGSIHVTLALTGLGKVYFDDLRIEPLVPGAGVVPTRR
jgi:hypothetical protein